MMKATDWNVAGGGLVASRLGPLVGLAATVACLCLGPLIQRASAQTASQSLVQTRSEVQIAATHSADCKILYVGIVGGLETSGNRRSGLVQIRNALRGPAYGDVCAKTFSPYDWMAGRRWILKHFPTHGGAMTADELKQGPRVILVGHSLGGWGVLSVARGLDRKGIPVELSIQVDSVGITDRTVPKNVKAAAIFHARDILMFMTTKKIKAQDASQTTIVENIRVKGAGHESITRDARIRELVLRMVDSLRASPPLADVRPLESSAQHGDGSVEADRWLTCAAGAPVPTASPNQ